MRIYICSLLATFLGGFATALLVSYPIHENSLVVCFWAVILMLWACLLGAWAIVERSVTRSRIKVDRLVEVMIDEMADERGLRVVDRD